MVFESGYKKIGALAVVAFLIPLVGNGKTFVYCSEGSPSTFNPQLATDGTTFNASSRTIYSRLVDFEKGGTKIVPSLATEWKISKDGLSYTFELRKGVKYHTTEHFTPTRDFNADDVLFSFQRMKDKNHPYHSVGGGNYEYFESMEMGTLIKEIKKIDPYKIQFTLTKKEAPFLANMAMDFASILSAEYGDKLLQEKHPEKIDTLPIGTGPFKFKQYIKDNTIRYEAHKSYFEGASPLDQLVFSITQEASVRYQKLKTGECHLMAYPDPSDLKSMKDNNKIRVVEQPGLNVGYLAMNLEKKPLNNVLVRQAINHALNRQSYIEAIYLGNAEVAKNPIPPTMWGYNSKITDYDYSPEKAKDLLKKAGLEKGFSIDLWVLPVSRPYIPNGKKLGELIQSDLAKVGIKINLVTFDWPTYLAKAKKGEHGLIQLGWTGDNGDPDNFLNVLLGCPGIKAGSNVARWCDQTFSKYVDAAKQTSDIKQRTDFYLKAQEVFKKNAPWVTLAHAKVFRAMTPAVVGYEISPFGSDIFYGVDIK